MAGVTSAAEPAAEVVKVTRAGAQPSTPGPAANFTGQVRVDTAFKAQAPGRAGGGIVTFEPGARTAWHSHPLGQTLLVTAGVGRVGQWNAASQEIRPGDVVWIAAGVKHWHGATRTNGMRHVAIAESLDGKTTDWMEQVSDTQYQ
ncbi:cupin domain-containing protein [Massilia aurea]|uniref:(R)-mandelonitrile lyase n=1 Tax=Massilia aurea TaxID=373040 RepID=UPI0034636F43